MKRFELEAAATFDRWSFSLMYGDYAAQPEIGFLTAARACSPAPRSSSTPTGCCAVPPATTSKPTSSTRTAIGVGYIDDCFILGLNYVTSYSYGTGVPVLNHTVMLQLSLRTLGGTSASQNVGGQGTR